MGVWAVGEYWPIRFAEKQAEKYCSLIYYERKTLFPLKRKLESTAYKTSEQGL